MKRNSFAYSRQFLSLLTILIYTFTHGLLRKAEGRGGSVGKAKLYGCFALGWRSCRQTMNAATRPTKINAAMGISVAKSFMASILSLNYSSGINQVPTAIKTTIAIPVPASNFKLIWPVTNRPIRIIDTTNSTDRPKIAAKYLLLALLSLTNQEYHISGRSSTCR